MLALIYQIGQYSIAASSCRARHSGRVAGSMTNGMDNDLALSGFVKNEIWIRRGRHPPDDRIVRTGAYVGMQQQQIDDRLNAGVHAA